MAGKNKDGRSFNRSGIYDHSAGTITFVDPKGKEPEKVFDLAKTLEQYDGCEISVSVTTEVLAEPDSEE
jgi:hypothetical protein